MIRKRLDIFFDDLRLALQESAEVQQAVRDFRVQLDRALSALLPDDEAERQARLVRSLLPLSFLRRLDQDALIAASWLRERYPGRVLGPDDAYEVMRELIAALRASSAPLPTFSLAPRGRGLG